MNEAMFLEKWSKLPEHLKTKVEEYVDVLVQRDSVGNNTTPKPMFGSAKGMFIMQSKFDEQLEDFQAYM